MKRIFLTLALASSFGLTACGSLQEVVYRDAKAPKLGNKVAIPEDGVVADTLRIELMKQGKLELVTEGFDYILHINSILFATTVKDQALGAHYSISLTSKTGDIVFIRVLYSGSLKAGLAASLSEVAAFLM